MNSHWRTIPGYVRIASTGKSRGIEGEIKLYPEDQYLDDILNAEFLFVRSDGNNVPLRVESIREIQDILLKFTDVNDPTAAAKWTSAEVYLPADELTTRSSEEATSLLEYDTLIGYSISDVQLGNVGQIVEVREFPQQEMAVLKRQDREVLIPLNPVFIVGIDSEQQTVFMDLPAGLLEV